MKLTDSEIGIIESCLWTMLRKNYLGSEFATRLGATENEVQALALRVRNSLENITPLNKRIVGAVLNEFVNGLNIGNAWPDLFNFTREEARGLLDRWAAK